MKSKTTQIMLISLLGLFSGGCQSQNPNGKPDPNDRQPAVAGQFY